MPERLPSLLDKIRELEGDLRILLQEQESKALYRIQRKRRDFSSVLEQVHRRVRPDASDSRFNHARFALSFPFIYGMLIPLLAFDVCLIAYQAICFRLYGIPRVRRGSYIVTDRRHLPHLRYFEKINCEYCSYANGLMAFSREIFARTEQYWCPIKHARGIADPHGRYGDFVGYAEAEDYHRKLLELRASLMEEGKQGG